MGRALARVFRRTVGVTTRRIHSCSQTASKRYPSTKNSPMIDKARLAARKCQHSSRSWIAIEKVSIKSHQSIIRSRHRRVLVSYSLQIGSRSSRVERSAETDTPAASISKIEDPRTTWKGCIRCLTNFPLATFNQWMVHRCALPRKCPWPEVTIVSHITMS